MSDIDVEIFQFVGKLKAPEIEETERTAYATPPLHGKSKPIHLGKAKNLRVEGFDKADGSINSKFIEVDGKLIGLNKEDFTAFKELLQPLLLEHPFASLADIEFILTEAFKWLVRVYKDQRAETNFTSYLLNSLESSIEEHHFYFKVIPLAIQDHFTIGSVELTFFFTERDHRLIPRLPK